jgi:GTP-binding protein Era
MGFRAGFIVIIGRPNVGKSTLLNRLLNFKLSIISKKPQTTRRRIVGILTGEDYQAVFIDTPGIIEPRYSLERLMQREVAAGIKDADLLICMVEPFLKVDPIPIPQATLGTTKRVLVINKVDLLKDKRKLLPMIAAYAKAFIDVFPISALYGDGVDELKQGIAANLPLGEPFYPPDQLTQHPERFFCAEFIQEKIFELYGEEVPYATTVEIDEFRERPGPKDFIRAVIYVERESQRPILLGRKGSALKRLGELSRKEIEAFLGREVYLELWVKVKPGWRRDEGFIRRLYKD